MRRYERWWFRYWANRNRTPRPHPLEAWYLWIIHATALGIAWGITQHQRWYSRNTTSKPPTGGFSDSTKEG